MATESNLVSLKRTLAARIGARVRARGLTQSAAAQELGLSQPRLNALLKDRVELFSLDALVEIAGRVQLTVRLSATRPYGTESAGSVEPPGSSPPDGSPPGPNPP
ncbi:MAG: XRE family transcriptional regulator [Burkholderiales bacterium]|nr:XRE family transcriptional regulator [Burkholderiales bacterium]